MRSHFGALIDAVSAEGGAVVKTIGDAVMATFSSPDRGVRAAIRMREAMREINAERGGEDLALNIGLHEGPCLAVVLDDRQDYFGQSVNIAARVQGLADPSAILATKAIVDTPTVTDIIRARGFRTRSRESALRGVSEAFTIYEISDQRLRALFAAAEGGGAPSAQHFLIVRCHQHSAVLGRSRAQAPCSAALRPFG